MSIQENTRELQVVLEQANSLPAATTAVEIVQETGDSTVAVMSQKAVTDAIPTAVEAALTEAKESGEFDGADGYSPVRGTDYWTEADKAEIKSYVDESILGGAW